VKNDDTKLDGNLKNGDKITLLPDEHATNYTIIGNGSLELGTYSDGNITTKYVLKDNEITVSGGDEYAYKPEMVTSDMIDYFIGKLKTSVKGEDRDYADLKSAFKELGLINSYTGIIRNTGDNIVTIDEKKLVKTYHGVKKDTLAECKLLIVLEVTLTQNKNAPVTAFVVCAYGKPQINSETSATTSGGQTNFQQYGKFKDGNLYTIIPTSAYKTLDELVEDTITKTETDYVWTVVE
jgi:hypothetical protein